MPRVQTFEILAVLLVQHLLQETNAGHMLQVSREHLQEETQVIEPK